MQLKAKDPSVKVLFYLATDQQGARLCYVLLLAPLPLRMLILLPVVLPVLLVLMPVRSC